MKEKSTLFYFLLLVLLSTSMISCDKFEGNQTTPAYLQITDIDVIQNPDISTPIYLQDSSFLTKKITSAWIELDGVDIGVFDLPCRVPILKEGKHKIGVYPVVKQNGMAATRINYPFYEKIILEDLLLVPGEVISSNSILQTMYNKQAIFKWMEYFEDPSHELDSVVEVCSDPNIVKYGKNCGAIYLKEREKVTAKSKELIAIPNRKAVYLEMDYSTNVPFQVGLEGYSSMYNQSITMMAMELNPTAGEWKKIYIVLGRILPQMGNPEELKLVFTGINQEKISTAQIFFDNIKIVSY